MVEKLEGNMAIDVRNVSKTYRVRPATNRTLKDIFIHHDGKKTEYRKILHDISFSVKRGEALGIVGRNGSGKSTMLKLLTRIMEPDSGSIQMNGRTASLLELGAGFHPDMTGRENVYINASIYGFKKKDIDVKLNDIIEFSELGDHIDDPVRIYSSGMYMRLAFSVSINMDADIILIDEILAVGDEAFKAKCLNTLKEMKKNGAAIVLVSHSMSQIQSVCDEVIWLENGRMREIGECNTVCGNYTESMKKI